LAAEIAKLTPSRGSAFLRGVFAGRTMREVGNHRGARPISLALLAGLVAFEAVLAFGAGAVGIPGILLVRFTEGSGGAETTQASPAHAGGESVMAKIPAPTPEAKAEVDVPSTPPPPAAEPRLDNLADIPLDALDRPKPEPAGAEAMHADASGREVLPWDAVEPVPLSSDGPASPPPDSTGSLPKAVETAPAATPPAARIALPDNGIVESWVKAKATEIKGGDRARPLYHFEFWLDAPEEVKRRLVAVAYEFNTPAVQPQALVSNEEKTGFRVSAGGLACADKITITLKFNDGQSQQIAVDGCRLLG
jgi:hypothetical protein